MSEDKVEVVVENGGQKEQQPKVAGFVLGVISMFAWLLPLAGYPVSIVGLVLSVKAKKDPVNKLATAGMILSIIGLVLTVLNSIGGVLLSTMNTIY